MVLSQHGNGRGQDGEYQWIAQARSGDLEGFEHLYRLYARQVYGTCRRLLDTNQDAEDMTQRVFVRAWRRFDGYRADSRFGAWLRRIAVNLIIDERRAHWRERLEPMTAEHEERLFAPKRAPGTKVDLERCLMQLPPGARQVLVLHDVEGYTHTEMAALLGVTVGTTKTQLFRARRALKELLK